MNVRIVALVYADGRAADSCLCATARALAGDGLRVAGLLPHAVPRPGRSRCDMVLEDPLSGEHIRISEDRGELARGCRLDLGELLRAGEIIRASLAHAPDAVVVNKFGKSESEGGGLRDVLAEVVAHGTPLLIAVPLRNLAAWRGFLGEASTEIVLDDLPADEDARVARVCAALTGRR